MIRKIRRNILRNRLAPYARLFPFASLNQRRMVDAALTGMVRGLRAVVGDSPA